MTDNVAITAGSGTSIASDDIGGAHYQRVKVTWGPDGTANDADTATGKAIPVQVRSATGLVPIGEPTDAKSTATDTTSVSGISLWKQISASVQAAASSLAGTITVGTHAVTASGNFASTVADGANVTLGTKTDAKSTATDGTSTSVVSVLKQISASVQAAASSLAGSLTATVSGTVTASIAAAQTLATVTTVTTVSSLTAIANALPAGTNLLGKVKTPFFTAASGTLTRPANQTPYTATDEISATSPASLSVTVSDVNDGPVTLDRIRVSSSDTGFGAKAIRVWAYNGATTAGTDNATFATAKANYVGTFSGTLVAASDGAVGVLVPDAGSRVITLPASGAQTIQLRVQALDAATSSANSTTFDFTVEGFRGG